MKQHGDIIIIAYYYPPMGTVATLRNYIISKEFKRYFNKVHVITVKNRSYPMVENLNTDHVSTHEVRNFDYRLINKSKKPKHYNRNNAVFKFFSRLIDSAPFNFLIGEGGIQYIHQAYQKAAKLIQQGNVTHVYTSFRPWADHRVGRKIKKKFPNITWIADFRDLHVDPVLKNVLFPEYQHRSNQRIVKNADVLTTVSEGLSDNLSRYNKNTYVLYNGIYPLFKNLEAKENQDKFTISYTGSMYGENRNPQILMEALRELISEGLINREKLQFKYAGKDSQSWLDWMTKYQMEDIFVNCGYLSFRDSFILQRESHINILLTYAGANYFGGLTGKFYEYLAAEKPILLIIRGEQDQEFEDMFSGDSSPGLIAYSDPKYLSKTKSFLLKLYQHWTDHGSVPSYSNAQFIADFKWDHLMDKFMRHLDENEKTGS